MDLVQQQKVLSCYAGTYGMADYNAFVMSGRPKQGQTLDEWKDLFLAEIEKLKREISMKVCWRLRSIIIN